MWPIGVPRPSDTMERLDCSAVYIDDRVRSERWVYRSPVETQAGRRSSTLSDEPDSLQSDVDMLLGVCRQVYLCHAGTSFATRLAELNGRAGTDCTPVFAFFDIELAGEESVLARRKASRTSRASVTSSLEMSPPSPTSLRQGLTFSSQSEDSYGLNLLSGVSADIQVQEAPNIIIPIAVLRCGDAEENGADLLAEPEQMAKCLDAGAVDVMTTPLEKARVGGLLTHAYRTRKTAQKQQSRFLARRRLRKLSWVGVHDEQPYAYLREAMVSRLMKGICNPEEVIEEFQDRELDLDPGREEYVQERIGQWDFTAQEFSEDELVFGACEILEHALNMPELEPWRLTTGELRVFLLACRAAYNSFVLYHNFRHAIDVLQSVFCFLLHIGALPPYHSVGQTVPKTSLCTILTPFDALTLLISAIGHDVGHPGVNNFFLVKLNAPLAQLYNDNSVLEAFHCAAFSQILRRHWPAAFKDNQLRKLLISSILATDMGVHQKFMQRLGDLQERFYENGKSVDGWKPQDVEMYRTLICGLLIKCADISNVARPWAVAERWTKILQEEFANQGEMEREIGMETTLFGGPPEIGNIFKLATGQIGFISIFAIPLFEGVSDLLPHMDFTVEQIRRNQSRWTEIAELEKRKQALGDEDGCDPSPRTLSPVSPRRSERRSTQDREVEVPVRVDEPEADTKSHGSRDSSDTVDKKVLNENILSPVVSPDTPGPSIDITGIPYPPDTPSRKSSSAIPGATMLSMDSTSAAARPSPETRLQEASESTEDPAVLAAVIFSDAAKNEDNHANSASDNTASDRPSSSRHGPGHRPYGNRSSSGRASGPSSSHRDSGTRTQSVSTYSNPMTPISTATNATSFLIPDGDVEKYQSSKQPGTNGSDTQASGNYSYNHTHCTPGPTSHPNSHGTDDIRKNSVMTTLVRNESASAGTSTTTTASVSGSGSGNGKGPGGHCESGASGERKLPKRRSRLRLAFWKRRSHHSQQGQQQGQEFRGEI